MPIPDEEDEIGSGPSGSMADLFFALAALCIFLIVALVPSLHARAARPAPDAPRPDFADAVVFTAEAGGIRLPGAEGRLVPLDAVLDDPELDAGLRTAGERTLLLVGEDGHEADFLLNAAAARLGIGTYRQIRLPRACAVLPACAAPLAEGDSAR